LYQCDEKQVLSAQIERKMPSLIVAFYQPTPLSANFVSSRKRLNATFAERNITTASFRRYSKESGLACLTLASHPNRFNEV
jgi:hypothetical protein